MAGTFSNGHIRAESFILGIKNHGLNTDKNVNIGVSTGVTPNLYVAGNISSSGTFTGSLEAVTTLTTTTTLTAAQSQGTFLLNAAAGFTVTLPAPVVGLTYNFVVTTSVTSSSLKILTDASTTFLQGVITGATTTASVWQGNGTSHRSVAMNGTTTGGLIGTQYSFVCITATQWQVFGTDFGSGTAATPFATS